MIDLGVIMTGADWLCIIGHCYLTKPTGSFASMLSAYYENGTIPTEFENFYKDESRRNYFLGGEEGKAGLDTESLGRMGLFGMM